MGALKQGSFFFAMIFTFPLIFIELRDANIHTLYRKNRLTQDLPALIFNGKEYDIYGFRV